MNLESDPHARIAPPPFVQAIMKTAYYALVCVAAACLLSVSEAGCPTSNLLQVKPRQKAADFTATAVVNEKFEKISLSDYRGKW